MTKKGQFFKGKYRVTPSVTAPGDNNPNDATEESAWILRTIQKLINSA